MGSGVLRKLDPGDVEKWFRLLQEETVCASELEQSSAVAMLADEPNGAGKLAAQYGFGAEIIRIAVGMPAGEIIVRVIIRGVEIARLGTAEPAFRAAQDLAAVLAIQMGM